MVVVNLGKKHHRMWKLEKKHEVRDRILHGLKVPAHKILVHIFLKVTYSGKTWSILKKRKILRCSELNYSGVESEVDESG